MATTLDTPRLRLVPMTLDCANAIDDVDAIAGTCNARVADGWPVEHYDDDLLLFTRAALTGDPDCEYVIRYIVVRDPEPVVVGMVGSGAPDADGRMMIGYSVLPQFQRRGFASEALRAVIDWASRDARVKVIAGDTYPELIASIRTMESCGFHFVGDGEGDGVIRYEIQPARAD